MALLLLLLFQISPERIYNIWTLNYRYIFGYMVTSTQLSNQKNKMLVLQQVISNREIVYDAVPSGMVTVWTHL
jgi:hypothetical protein